MKLIRQWKITRTEQTTVRVLHVPESGSRTGSREPRPVPRPTVEAAPSGWKQMLTSIREWARKLAPALAVTVFFGCGCSLYGQSVIAAISANEITAITAKGGSLANVNNYTVPILSRNGNRVAFLTGDPTPGEYDVNVINADGTGQVKLATSPQCCLLDISDDGSLVVWGSLQGQLSIAAASGGGARSLIQFNGGYLFSPRISADNSKVFFVLDRNNSVASSNAAATAGVWSVNTDGTGLHQIVSAASTAPALGLTSGQVAYFMNGLDRSSDGTRIVFGVTGTPTGTAILSASSSGAGITPVMKNIFQTNWVAISGDGTKVGCNISPNPFGTPNQLVVTNIDGSGAVTLVSGLDNDGLPMQLTADGSQLLAGTAGRLYRTDGSGFLLLSPGGPADELPGDPPTLLNNGTYGGTMNLAGTRIAYIVGDANNIAQVVIMDINPASTGGAPVMSNPGVTPDFVLINGQTAATETVTVTPTTANVYRVSTVTVVAGVPDTGSGGAVYQGPLYNDGTHGSTKGSSTYTNNGVTALSNATLGTRMIVYRGEALDSSGKRHASELQLSPFSVLKTAPYTYTVAASTPGLTVVVDAIAYTAPQQFLWDAGDTHIIDAPSPQTFQGKTYTWGNWSDNGTQSHSVTAPGGNTNYTAIFSSSGGGCGNSPFVGTFTTSLGVLTVIQNPNCSLTGTIPGGPTFTGTATGSTWTGSFTGPSGSGTFTFTAGNGGISGPYTYTSGSGTSGSLTTSAGGCGATPFTGTYNTALGSLTVVQNSNCSLTGTIPGGPTFTGTATGTTWTGTFTSPNGSGTFNFTAGNGGFTGGYTYTSGSGTNGTVTASTGGVNPNCAYNFPATTGVPTALSGAGYNNLIFTLQTAPACTWSVAAVDSWIHIQVPTPNTTITGGSGVSVLLDANPSATTARTGTITISWPGGSGSNLVTQGAGPSCTFTLSPAATPTSISANGGTGSFAVTAAPTSCLWSATTPDPAWITIGNASGPSPVNFKVAANGPYPAAARQGFIMVQGQTYTVNQDAAPSPNAPVISSGGVTNAASYASASPPNGGVAQGSYISIFGTGLGPPAGAQAPAGAALSPTLAGVSVTIASGGSNYNVLPTFVAGPQINAIVPSNTPVGVGALTVTYNGATSASAPVMILANALGIFTVGNTSEGIIQTFPPTAPLGDQPLNSNNNTAATGDYGIVWATGLGANIVNGQLLPDNTPPPGGQMAVPVTVTIDGIPAQIPYSGRAPGFAGVDNVYFIVPPGVRSSCTVAVKIQAGALPANAVTIATDANHQPCAN